MLVSAVFVFFRANSLPDAIAIFEHFFWIPHSGDLARLGVWMLNHKFAAIVLIAAAPIALYAPNLYEVFEGMHQPIGFKPRLKISPMVAFRPNLLWGVIMGLLFWWCVLELLRGQETPFLYFQF